MAQCTAMQIDAASEPAETLDARFIGVRPDDLAGAIGADEAFGIDGTASGALLEAFIGVVEMELGAFRRRLDRLYAPFNPDRDTVVRDGDQSAAAAGLVRQGLTYAFEKANFFRLGDVDIKAALNSASRSGMKVKLDPDSVESLDLFVRGKSWTERRQRHWRAPFKGRLERLEVYRRLGVIVRPKGGESLQLRLYRDIPAVDVEALLPHADVAMSWTDRAKVAVGGAGALGGIGSKVVTGGVILSPSSLAIPAAVAFGGLGVKSFLGYKRARRTRVGQRTHHLYNLSLASNTAVLHSLLWMVASQEVSEGLLLYAALASGVSREEAKGWIEGWLEGRFGVDVDFEIEDAAETLDRLSLWADGGTRRVIEIEDARERLRAHLAEGVRRDYHVVRAGLEAGQEGALGS